MNLRIAIIGLAFLPASALADNLLLNPGFEEWYNGNDFETYTGNSSVTSTATGWFIDNSQNSGTTTVNKETPPPGLADAGNFSILVTNSAPGDGLAQVTHGFVNGIDTPDVFNSISGWVYVNSGSVGIGYVDFNTFQTVIVDSTSVTGQWVNLASNVNSVQAGGFVIFGLSANSSFYADNMDGDSNSFTPEPAPFAALGLGALALLRRRNRKK